MQSMLVLVPLACGEPSCSRYNPWTWNDCVSDYLCRAISTAVSPIFKLLFEMIGHMVALAVGATIKAVGALWIYVPTLHPASTGNFAPVEAASFVRGQVGWLLVAVTVVSAITAGAKVAWQQRGEPARKLFRGLLTVAVVSATVLAMVTVLTQAADLLAQSFINRAVDESGVSFAENLAALISGPMLATGGLGLPFIMIFGFAAVLMSFLQIILMIVRNAMLILLTGILPLTAAAANTEMGQAGFRKSAGWLVAFIIYKPIAALIYASSIMLAGNQQSLVKVLIGLTMMALAVIALPALLRLVSPSGGS